MTTFTSVGENAVGPRGEENAPVLLPLVKVVKVVKGRGHFSPRVNPSDLVLTSVLGFGTITGLSPRQGSRDSSWSGTARQETGKREL